jgi:cell division protein FtsL
MSAAVAHKNQVAERSDSGLARRRPAGPRPRLEVLDQVAARRRTRRRNALAVAFVVVLAGLFAVAFVHAQLVESQQELDQLRGRIAELEDSRAEVERAINEASAPALVVERASELGMVPAEDPAFLVAVRETSDG